MDKIECINIWYDNAGHYLDVFWVSKAGNYFMPTSNERVDVLVDDDRNLSGFMVWGVTRVKEGEIVNLELTPVEPELTLQPEPAAALELTPVEPELTLQPEPAAALELTPVEPELTLQPEPAAALATAQLVHVHPIVQAGSTVEIKNISIHADKAGDYFEVYWAAKLNTDYTSTGDDRVQALRDAAGNILGFKITGISLMGEGERDFINVDLHPVMPAPNPLP